MAYTKGRAGESQEPPTRLVEAARPMGAGKGADKSQLGSEMPATANTWLMEAHPTGIGGAEVLIPVKR